MIKRILPYYFFLMECFLLYAALFLLYIPKGQHPPVGAFLIMLLLANVTLFLGLRNANTNTSFLFLGATVSAVAGFLIALGAVSSFISTFFLFFRIYAFIKDATLWKNERAGIAIIFYLICLLLIAYGLAVDYNEINLLYCLPIAYALFYTAGRYMQQMVHQHQLRFLKSILSSISIAGVVTLLFTLILPFVKWAFFGLLQGLITIIVFIAAPGLNMFEGKQHKQKIILKLPRNKITHKIAKHIHFSEIPGWVWIVLLTIIFISIFFIVRRINVERGSDQDSSAHVKFEHVPLYIEKKRKFLFVRVRAPQEYLRRIFFELHQLAAKNKLDRYSNETVREWFDRIGLPKDENLLLAYEKVRYGKASISKNEGARFSSIIEELKMEIKNRSKKNNEDN